MELRQIEHAVTVAEHSSFRRAADALRMSQPTLTRSIQRLEHALGIRLFDRSRSGVQPTDAGQVFLARAKALLLQRDDLTREMMLRRGLQVGELAVGVGPYPSEMNVAPALAQLIDTFPGLRVHVIVERSQRSIAQLRQREIDLLVGDLSDLGEMTDLTQQPFRSHQGYFVVRASHPLTQARDAQLTDVLGYPLVTSQFLPERVTRPLHASFGAIGSVPSAIPAIQTDSPALMRAVVTASNAVGIFALTMITGELCRGELVVLPVVPSWLCTNCGIVRLARRTPSPEAEHFMQLVKTTDEELTQHEQKLREEFLVSRRKRKQ